MTSPLSNPPASRIDTRPQPTLAVLACLSIAGLVVVTVGAAALVPLDQIVTLPGRLVPQRPTQSLASPEAGRVVRVLVQEGQQVEAGQELLVLDPRLSQVDVTELERQLQAASELEQRQRLTLEQRLASLERQLGLDLEVLLPLEQLARQGGAPGLQVTEQRRQVEQTRRQIDDTRGELAALQAQAAQLRAEQRRQLAAARERLALRSVRAPVRGSVFDLKAQTGQVAAAGQSLLQLVPESPLRVEAHARDDNLAFLQAGQSAQVAVSAYDPSRYGLLQARVSQVSADALPPSHGIDYPHVPVQLVLDSQALERQGQRFALQAGMAVTAQVNLQQRTLLELFFSRLQQGLTAVRSIR
ncbi:MAG: HlyD family secretion protein [Cyanobacteriota bacterium]